MSLHPAIPSMTEKAILHYTIDPAASSFTVQAFSTGLLSSFGHNPRIAVRDFQGEVRFSQTGARIEDAQLTLRIRAGSLENIDDISENDRRQLERTMQDEVLASERFPEISYQASNLSVNAAANRFWTVLNGRLTLRGITKTQPVSVRVVMNGETLRASGEFDLKQSNFGITPVKVAAGAIRLKDEVKCTFDIVARKET
jgi:polyisoprenoid-binding protein YceI